MSISVVIPSYNGLEILEKNLLKVLEILEQDKTGEKELIIIDDKSSDGSYKFLQKFKEEYSGKIAIKIAQNSENKGFSSTVNKGVKVAEKEIIILLNSDVVPHPNFLSPLLDHFKDQEFFAVGCMDESVEGENIVNRGRGIGRWARGFLVHGAGDIDKNSTLWVSGGSGAFRKAIWEKLGGLEEIYNPFYWEDIDLSYRAIKSGYKIAFENKSIVRHEHEKGAIKKHFNKSFIKKISYRNQIIFVWLNITDFSYLVSHIAWLPYYFASTLLKGDYLFIYGLILAIKELPKILGKRQLRQKMFSLSDKEILLPFSSEF